MKSLWNAFWADESGMILSAEAALLGTVGIVGATVGLSAAAHAIDDELQEMAFAIRSLDQSFAFEGQKSEFAWTAGSSYRQPPVEESHRILREEIRQRERAEEKAQQQDRHKTPKEKAEPEKAPSRRRDRKREADRKKEASVEKVDSHWEIDGFRSTPPAG